jgi:NAD(P)H-quinone oxidoreductase subunit 5
MKSRRLSVSITHSLMQVLPVFSLAMFVWCQITGPFSLLLTEFTLASLPIRLGFEFNALSTLLLSMVSLLSFVISKYGLRYLDGEPRQTSFYKNMLVTVTAVCLLVLSDNLLMFFLSWILTSFGIRELLLFYPTRVAAQAAAKKKMFVSRVGDAALLIALGMTYHMFHTFNFDGIFRVATDPVFGAENVLNLNILGCLFAIAAITKSAQYPFHFWLPETMETPTPVSALMHAGVINAGGFLIIRLSPILTHAEWPHAILTLIGAWTAAYAGLIMITQNDIKKKLAYSTISQMGMMLFACGLGAYSIALLHIIGHSFYKAHAFLSTGEVVGESRKTSAVLHAPSTLYFSVVAFFSFSLVVVGALQSNGTNLAYFTYAAVMAMALLANRGAFPKKSFSKQSYFSLVLSLLTVGVTLYVLVELYFNAQLQTLVADTHDYAGLGSIQFLVNLAALAIIVAAAYVGTTLMGARSAWSEKLYVHLWNGGYFGAMTNRWLNRWWPIN